MHLNVQFEEPLVPDAGDGWGSALDGAPDGGPWMTPGGRPVATPEPVSRDLRTVVVAGDDAGPPARVLAETAGWPLLAEPTSGSRTGEAAIRTYRLLLGDPELAGRIQQVVVFGHPTLSRPVSRLLARDDIELYAVRGPSGWTDSGHHVHAVVDRIELEGVDASWFTSEKVAPPAREPDPWLAEWRRRDAELSRRLDQHLAQRGTMTPQQVAGTVSAALPPGGLLFVGASNPVRDLDLMVAKYAVGDRRMVVGNRGLAGIDGSVSSAIGAALGRPRSTRAIALLGDVTFLHDTNGLLLGPGEERPDLTIVVVNDDGGSIFASLEQGGEQHAASYDKLFGTPHGVDVASLCAATRTPHWKVGSVAELQHALASPAGGIEVVEAVVRRDDRRELDAAIRALRCARLIKRPPAAARQDGDHEHSRRPLHRLPGRPRRRARRPRGHRPRTWPAGCTCRGSTSTGSSRRSPVSHRAGSVAGSCWSARRTAWPPPAGRSSTSRSRPGTDRTRRSPGPSPRRTASGPAGGAPTRRGCGSRRPATCTSTHPGACGSPPRRR